MRKSIKECFIIKTLVDAKVFETVFVKDVVGEKSLKYRILELGITKGVKIFVKRFAPMGSPVEIFVRGYNLCLGTKEAKSIILV